MSGIYGIIKKSDSSEKLMTDGIEAWNKAYGNESYSFDSAEGAFFGRLYRIGACKESFKSRYEKDSALTVKNSIAAVIDALIYDRAGASDDELSDEAYLTDLIKNKGISYVKDVNGDFAGAVLNTDQKTLYLFRDHMGVRPLFYYAKEDLIIFSTDIRGITSIEEADTEVDENWVYRSLSGAYEINVEDTEYKYIKCVPSGGYIKIEFNINEYHITQGRYWVPGKKKIRLKSKEEYIKKHRELITDAIRIRLNAVEGKIGAELSGGLDSSVIDILINRLGRKCTFFSWTPGEDEVPIVDGDERLIIKDICENEKIDCHYGNLHMKMKEDSMIAKMTPLLIDEKSLEEHVVLRYALPAYMNTLDICETAEFMHGDGVMAVFTGHGGDEGVSHRCNPYELFYNHEYYRYLKTMWARTYKSKNRIPDTFKLACKNIRKQRNIIKAGRSVDFALKDFFNKDFQSKLSGKKNKANPFPYNPKEYIRDGGSRSRLDVVALFGAYNRVRYIAPYVDYRLIDYSLGIPRYLFLNGFQDRYIFRQAFEDIMPKSLYKLQSKDEKSLLAYWANNKEEKEKRDVSTPESRQYTVNILDKKYWKKFLDYDYLEKWVKEGEALTGMSDIKVNTLIMTLYVAENMVKKSRNYIDK